MSKQIIITRYSLFRTKIAHINEWKQVDVLFFRQIYFVQFLNFFVNKLPEYLVILTDVVLVSYKPVSYLKKACS